MSKKKRSVEQALPVVPMDSTTSCEVDLADDHTHELQPESIAPQPTTPSEPRTSDTRRSTRSDPHWSAQEPPVKRKRDDDTEPPPAKRAKDSSHAAPGFHQPQRAASPLVQPTIDPTPQADAAEATDTGLPVPMETDTLVARQSGRPGVARSGGHSSRDASLAAAAGGKPAANGKAREERPGKAATTTQPTSNREEASLPTAPLPSAFRKLPEPPKSMSAPGHSLQSNFAPSASKPSVAAAAVDTKTPPKLSGGGRKTVGTVATFLSHLPLEDEQSAQRRSQSTAATAPSGRSSNQSGQSRAPSKDSRGHPQSARSNGQSSVAHEAPASTSWSPGQYPTAGAGAHRQSAHPVAPNSWQQMNIPPPVQPVTSNGEEASSEEVSTRLPSIRGPEQVKQKLVPQARPSTVARSAQAMSGGQRDTAPFTGSERAVGDAGRLRPPYTLLPAGMDESIGPTALFQRPQQRSYGVGGASGHHPQDFSHTPAVPLPTWLPPAATASTSAGYNLPPPPATNDTWRSAPHPVPPAAAVASPMHIEPPPTNYIQHYAAPPTQTHHGVPPASMHEEIASTATHEMQPPTQTHYTIDPEALPDTRGPTVIKPTTDAGITVVEAGCDFKHRHVQRKLLELLQDPDATVVVRGGASRLSPELWCWRYIIERCRAVVWPKFKEFKKEGDRWIEKRWLTMSLGEYDDYLNNRSTKYNRQTTAIYLLDFPIPQYVPELMNDLRDNYDLVALLPGGNYCGLRYVAELARPPMGPNLYITPPHASTWFHEDGHGTVDSGHQAMKGRNKVIILGRMSKALTDRALNILWGRDDEGAQGLPHDEGMKPAWPTQEQLDKLREIGANPRELILEPGDFMHINKSRMHAFFKEEPKSDANKHIMPLVIADDDDELCVSFAWDWSFEGFTAKGVQGETKSAVEAAARNAASNRASLGVPVTIALHTSLAGHAANAARKELTEKPKKTWINGGVMDPGKFAFGYDELLPLAAVLGAEKVVAGAPVDAHTVSGISEKHVDAFDGNGYICSVCTRELPNQYYHCRGCEQEDPLSDWNICGVCYDAKRFVGSKPEDERYHAGRPVKKRCDCPRNQPTERCTICKACKKCVCACHHDFEVRYRFLPGADYASLSDDIRQAHGGAVEGQSGPSSTVKSASKRR